MKGFWQLLASSQSAIDIVPSDRWDYAAVYDPDPTVPGKANTKWGGFLAGADLFDRLFFQMSESEAIYTDPQQRLVLELGWEAIEHAGIAASKLRGVGVGVYVGISHNDYERLIYKSAEDITKYHGTGSYHSVAANRLSYFLDLTGPSCVVDTACSSALSALHVAVHALQRREIPMAIVAGVTLHITPDETIGLTKGGLLSGRGMCSSFDESADGYVRGDGGGALVLQRLEDALKSKANVLAVIRGSALGHNGRSNGLSAFSGRAQQDLMRRAMDSAGVGPSEITFIETHGTGTPLGDQIELRAIVEVFGAASQSEVCWLGCSKTNIGHLESASGVASIIKVLLCFKKQQIPGNLNREGDGAFLNVHSTGLRFPLELQSWTVQNSTRIAMVNTYGFGGANGSVILESHAILTEASDTAVGVGLGSGCGAQVMCLSARNEKAVIDLCGKYLDFLEEEDPSIEDICLTASEGRDHFGYRKAFVVRSTDELRTLLRDSQQGSWAGAMSPVRSPKVDVRCDGSVEYAHYRQLCSSSAMLGAAGLEALERCDEWLRRRHHLSLREGLAGEWVALKEEQRIAIAFTYNYVLWERWKSWGVKPSRLMASASGHYVCAAIAGVFSPEEALRLRMQQYLLTGPGFWNGDLQESQREIYQPPQVTIYSTDAQASLSATHAVSEKYWDNFATADGNCSSGSLDLVPGRVVLDLSNDLVTAGAEVTSRLDRIDGSSNKPISEDSQRIRLCENIKTLYLAGLALNWTTYNAGSHGRKIPLPTYPFQRSRFWFQPSQQPNTQT
jgi:acyl transferase domain-containing protein